MKQIIFLSLFFIALFSQGQNISTTTVRPNTTDPAIVTGNDWNLPHYMMTGVDTNNTLVVWLHGTYRQPYHYTTIMTEIAKQGNHVIGLMYIFDPAVNPLCKTSNDVTCHSKARLETIDGVDRHPGVNVNFTNSIINRLDKLLKWLVANQPTKNWGQFYVNGKIVWSKIIIAGHSQGASLAGVMGKQSVYPVKRVVMWSVMDFYDNGIPDWVNNSTGHEKYYALFHAKETVTVPLEKAIVGWDRLGMTRYGTSVIQCNVYPYNNAHILYTVYPGIGTQASYHDGTALDSYLTLPENAQHKSDIERAIKYLFRK